MQPAYLPTGSVGGDAYLLSRSIQVERKHITFDLAENPRGRFLRITETVAGLHNAIIIPLSGVEEFRDAINKLIEFSKPFARPVRPLPSVRRQADAHL
jgi:hypothetical protein